jgi:hypothetical protein
MAEKYDLMVDSPNIKYTDEHIEADYVYESVKCVRDEETKRITVSTFV